MANNPVPNPTIALTTRLAANASIDPSSVTPKPATTTPAAAASPGCLNVSLVNTRSATTALNAPKIPMITPVWVELQSLVRARRGTSRVMTGRRKAAAPPTMMRLESNIPFLAAMFRPSRIPASSWTGSRCCVRSGVLTAQRITSSITKNVALLKRRTAASPPSVSKTPPRGGPTNPVRLLMVWRIDNALGTACSGTRSLGIEPDAGI